MHKLEQAWHEVVDEVSITFYFQGIWVTIRAKRDWELVMLDSDWSGVWPPNSGFSLTGRRCLILGAWLLT